MKRLARTRWLAHTSSFSCCVLLACATTRGPSEPATASAAPIRPARVGLTGASALESAAPADPNALRTLGANATFADLVRLARSLGMRADASSDAGCLLARAAHDPNTVGGHVLLADLMPSLEGMPDPPTDLAARMREHAGPVAMLTAWGPAGSAQSPLAFASFTTLPADRASGSFVLLAIDGDEAFIRSGAAATQDARELAIPGAIAQVRALLASAPAALYVTAGASTTLMQLRNALAGIELSTAVALAVLLPAGTTLPATPAVPLAADACPDGLPDPGDVDFGDLAREAITPALASLHEGIAPCLSSMRSATARVVVALRIDAFGQTQHACLLDAGGLDPRTASCVLLSARALQTPVPRPSGIVDLHLPLALQADGPRAQRALCDP